MEHTLTDFPPFSTADVSIPAPSDFDAVPNLQISYVATISPPPLEASFGEWLETTFPAAKEIILPLPKDTTPRPICIPRSSRRSRRTERSRRFAERRLENLPPSRPRPENISPFHSSSPAEVPTSLKKSPRPPELSANARSFSLHFTLLHL